MDDTKNTGAGTATQGWPAFRSAARPVHSRRDCCPVNRGRRGRGTVPELGVARGHGIVVGGSYPACLRGDVHDEMVVALVRRETLRFGIPGPIAMTDERIDQGRVIRSATDHRARAHRLKRRAGWSS